MFMHIHAHRMIYLGETFNGFVTVHNDSSELVREVTLKVRDVTDSSTSYL